jgi:hypothetical protein
MYLPSSILISRLLSFFTVRRSGSRSVSAELDGLITGMTAFWDYLCGMLARALLQNGRA